MAIRYLRAIGALLFGLLLCLISIKGFAQSSLPAPEAEQLRFSQLTVEDGISSAQVYSAVQDVAGFIWFGTRFGLNRFDGTEIKNYFMTRTTATALATTGSGTCCWIVTACSGLGATRVPEQKEMIIELLLGRCVQPDFSDSTVLEEWQQLIRQTSNKKILHYFMNKINFPKQISDQIQAIQDKPRY